MYIIYRYVHTYLSIYKCVCSTIHTLFLFRLTSGRHVPFLLSYVAPSSLSISEHFRENSITGLSYKKLVYNRQRLSNSNAISIDSWYSDDRGIEQFLLRTYTEISFALSCCPPLGLYWSACWKIRIEYTIWFEVIVFLSGK